MANSNSGIGLDNLIDKISNKIKTLIIFYYRA